MGASRSESTVNALLAQFPSLVVLRPPRGAAIRGFATGALLLGLGVWECAIVAPGYAWICVCVALFGLLIAVRKGLQLAGKAFLRLDRSGFSVVEFAIERRHVWKAVSDFAPRDSWPIGLVAFSRAGKSKGAVVAIYGFRTGEPFRLLTGWRRQALAEAEVSANILD